MEMKTGGTDEPIESPHEGRGRLRRGLLALVGGVFAAGALKTGGAKAASNTTVISGATAQYGLLASPGAAGAPLLPTLGSTNHGVIGSNTTATVLPVGSGVAGARNGANLAGVLGVNGSDGYGVYGSTDAGVGVEGLANSGIAVRGTSSSGAGVQGKSTSSYGVVAVTKANAVAALYAASLAPTTRIAALLSGNVRVKGDLSVTGAKAAAVEMADGSLGTMYCQESPEPYFEDFGRGQLINGIGRVAFEPEFASLIRRDNVMVFVTPEADCNGLYVSARDESGFEVRELRGGRGNCPFTYRLVAKRKDIEGVRLARIEQPIEPGVASVDDEAPAKRRHFAALTGPDEDFLPARG